MTLEIRKGAIPRQRHLREGFRGMLEADFEVIGEAADGRQAVVLMDIAMPQPNGLEASRQVIKALPAAKVVMLSALDDDGYAKNQPTSARWNFCSNNHQPTMRAGPAHVTP